MLGVLLLHNFRRPSHVYGQSTGGLGDAPPIPFKQDGKGLFNEGHPTDGNLRHISYIV
jgi:hypothetical protein